MLTLIKHRDDVIYGSKEKGEKAECEVVLPNNVDHVCYLNIYNMIHIVYCLYIIKISHNAYILRNL